MNQRKPKLGLSLMPTDDFHQATDELFRREQVEVIEWNFDFAWNGAIIEP